MVLFLLVLIVPITWPGPMAGAPHAMAQLEQGMPLARLVGKLFALHAWTIMAVGLLLVATCALMLDRLANEVGLFDRPNHLVALLFAPALAMGPNGMWTDPALLGLPFVLLAIGRGWSVQGKAQALGALFDTGLLIGLAGLWYYPYLFLVVVFWASLAVMRPFHWREYVMPVLASAVVLFLAWGIMNLMDAGPWAPMRTIATGSSFAVKHRSTLWFVFVLVVMAPMALWGVAAFAGLYQRSIMREKNVRSSYLALTLAMVVLIGLELLLNHTFPAALLATPLAILYAYALLKPRREALAELAVIALFSGVLWMRWGG